MEFRIWRKHFFSIFMQRNCLKFKVVPMSDTLIEKCSRGKNIGIISKSKKKDEEIISACDCEIKSEILEKILPTRLEIRFVFSYLRFIQRETERSSGILTKDSFVFFQRYRYSEQNVCFVSEVRPVAKLDRSVRATNASERVYRIRSRLSVTIFSTNTRARGEKENKILECGNLLSSVTQAFCPWGVDKRIIWERRYENEKNWTKMVARTNVVFVPSSNR